MQPKLYTIRPGGFKEIRQKLLMRLIPLFLIVFFVVGYLNFSSLKYTEGDYTSIYFASAIFLFYGVFGISRTLNKRKKMFESYSLSIDANSIWRDIKDTPSIHLYRTEIEKIQVLPNKSLLIKSKEKENMICVPAQVSNYDDLVNILSEIKPIEPTGSLLKKQIWVLLATIGALGLIVLTFYHHNKYIVTVSGASLVILSIIFLKKIKANNNIDYKTKRGLNWYWVLMVVLVIRVIFIWLGYVD